MTGGVTGRANDVVKREEHAQPRLSFHVITLFPEMVDAAARTGLVGQAIDRGTISVQTLNPREFTSDAHHTVDDRPFGGGDGMVMLAEPLDQALAQIQAGIQRPAITLSPDAEPSGASASDKTQKPSQRVLHLSPRGRPFTDAYARELAQLNQVVLISSRYAGLDQRFINERVDEELSIGDYVLTGGELAALVVIDAVSRLVPGVLGNQVSSEHESFAGGRGLEHPQFTRPRDWLGHSVPPSYLSGDHAKIAKLQQALSVLTTLQKRPDMKLTTQDLKEAKTALKTISNDDLKAFGLESRELLSVRLEAALTQGDAI